MEEDKICIVVPCYNEGKRLNLASFQQFTDHHPHIHFIFVDDGSTDDTPALLRKALGNSTTQFHLLTLDANSGKAAAVRHGMLAAIDGDYAFAGYWDADLSTPLQEIHRLHKKFDDSTLDIAIGSRVKILGHTIERKFIRHIAGRIFATAASLSLKIPVYDTQCGAKLFRNNKKLRMGFSARWMSGWAFDVELLHRYLLMTSDTNHHSTSFINEVPLTEWQDTSGSKVRYIDFFIGMYELLKISLHYNKTETREFYSKFLSM